MHPTHHVLDTVILTASAVATAVTSLALQDVHDPSAAAELQLFLLPFLGALILSGGIIMLNPQPETRRITIGRSIIAIFFGVLMPQVLGMFHPALATLSLKPVILVLAGGVFATLAYVLSRPFTAELYARAGGIAKREADKLEAKYSPPTPPKD